MNLASRKQIPCLVERTKQGIAERKSMKEVWLIAISVFPHLKEKIAGER